MKKVTVDCERPEYKQAVERLVQVGLKESRKRFGLGIFEDRPLRIEITIESSSIPTRNPYLGELRCPPPLGNEIIIHWIRMLENGPTPDEYMRSLVGPDGSMFGTIIFGLLHEVGHTIFPDIREDLPKDIVEGWATFFAWSLIPSVWEELGADAWPIPHNYFDYEMQRKRKTIEDPQTTEEYYISAFFRIEEESGQKGIFNIVKGLMKRDSSAIEHLDETLNTIKSERHR